MLVVGGGINCWFWCFHGIRTITIAKIKQSERYPFNLVDKDRKGELIVPARVCALYMSVCLRGTVTACVCLCALPFPHYRLLNAL